MSAASLLPIVAAAALAACLAACSDDATCVDIDTACTPLYEPTFENVFEITLRPSCGVAGSQCHAREGAQAGLVFADIDEAYSLLTEQPGPSGAPRVDREAGDIGCGTLLSRVASPDLGRVMPPGAPLPASEVCAIATWVAKGAAR